MGVYRETKSFKIFEKRFYFPFRLVSFDYDGIQNMTIIIILVKKPLSPFFFNS